MIKKDSEKKLSVLFNLNGEITDIGVHEEYFNSFDLFYSSGYEICVPFKKGDIITHINDVQITSNAVALDIIENTAPNVAMSFTVYHTEEKTSETIYAVLLPDQGNSSYTNKVTEGETNDPFGNGSNLDDFFSDH